MKVASGNALGPLHSGERISGRAQGGDPLAVLRAARETLADPARWTRGAYACDACGNDVGVLARDAARWCGSGVLRLHGAEADGPEANLLRLSARALFGLPPVRVNDQLGYAAVLRMYDHAIDLAARAGSTASEG